MGTSVTEHVNDLHRALDELVEHGDRLESWGRTLATVLHGGGRLLVAGNGGSAAHAQHLSGELVGRYRSERRALSAIALHAETTSLTAIVNDYGAEAAFARQVEAHGRAGDVLLLISTSGESGNLLHAAEAGRRSGLRIWAFTGPAPNPLAQVADQSIPVAGACTATVQEVHQVALHLLCAAVDETLARLDGRHLRVVGGVAQ